MSGRLVNDELWAETEELFPTYEQLSKGGRPPVEDRLAFTCLVFMLKSAIGWRDMPSELRACEKTVRHVSSSGSSNRYGDESLSNSWPS